CLAAASDLVELRAKASRDALTGLRSHARFHEELRERQPVTVAIALFDVDRFKVVNDTLGHLAGDRVLREVADALAGSMPIDTMLFRIGGDELAAILPTSDPDAAADMAETMILAATDILVPCV